MATTTKRTPSARSTQPSAAPAVKPGLRPSATPGVYLNSFNIPVDEAGCALSFKQVRHLDQQSMEEVIGEPANTPAKYLKAISLDPRQPTQVRIEAAKAAAPYTDRKQPMAVDGGVDPNTGASIPLYGPTMFVGWPAEDLAAMRALILRNKAV